MRENPGVAGADVTPFVSCPWDPRLCQVSCGTVICHFGDPQLRRRRYWPAVSLINFPIVSRLQCDLAGSETLTEIMDVSFVVWVLFFLYTSHNRVVVLFITPLLVDVEL